MNTNNENILDIPTPPIAVPILTPSKATAKVKSLKSMAKNAYDTVRKKMNEFSDYILGHVPEPIKKPINEKIEALKLLVFGIYKKRHSRSFKIRESDSALKGFAKLTHPNHLAPS